MQERNCRLPTNHPLLRRGMPAGSTVSSRQAPLERLCCPHTTATATVRVVGAAHGGLTSTLRRAAGRPRSELTVSFRQGRSLKKQPSANRVNHVGLFIMGQLAPLGNAMPFLEASPAACRRCMLRDENGMALEGSLLPVVCG